MQDQDGQNNNRVYSLHFHRKTKIIYQKREFSWIFFNMLFIVLDIWIPSCDVQINITHEFVCCSGSSPKYTTEVLELPLLEAIAGFGVIVTDLERLLRTGVHDTPFNLGCGGGAMLMTSGSSAASTLWGLFTADKSGAHTMLTADGSSFDVPGFGSFSSLQTKHYSQHILNATMHLLYKQNLSIYLLI